jgi:hypothetical protein
MAYAAHLGNESVSEARRLNVLDGKAIVPYN